MAKEVGKKLRLLRFIEKIKKILNLESSVDDDAFGKNSNRLVGRTVKDTKRVTITTR